MNTLAENPIIIIIDVGGSYQKQVENFGGKYFRVSEEYTINPFHVDTNGTDLTVAQYWQNIIEVMIRENNQPLNNDEKYCGRCYPLIQQRILCRLSVILPRQ